MKKIILAIFLLATVADAQQYATWPVVSGGSGTVTSITAGTGLSGGTITTSGTISLAIPVTVPDGGSGDTSFTANAVVVGNGTNPLAIVTNNASATNEFLTQSSSGAPAWAALVSGDIPNNAANTSGSAASFTGSLVGDVTGTQGATTIGAGAVTSAKIAASTIVDSNISASAAIETTKLSGAVTSIASNGLGTAATLNVGTGANNIVQLNGSSQLPAVDGSQLTNLPAASLTCPSGYILVPGNSTFTNSSFCVMAYDASQSSSGTAVSVAGGAPWVSISWYAANDACLKVGAHLMNEGEWMTIARNIEATAINNIGGSGTQLATGYSKTGNSSPLAAPPAGAQPSLTSCTLTLPLSDASNASCGLRGPGTYAGNNTDVGYYGTGNGYSQAYSSGGSNMSQMRTFVLSNGNIVWDFAGNVWQWTNALCDTTTWWNSGAYEDWNNASLATDVKFAGPATAITSANGAGQYYGCAATGDAMLRGGYWLGGSHDGVFAANLTDTPSLVSSSVGFRCAFSNAH